MTIKPNNSNFEENSDSNSNHYNDDDFNAKIDEILNFCFNGTFDDIFDDTFDDTFGSIFDYNFDGAISATHESKSDDDNHLTFNSNIDSKPAIEYDSIIQATIDKIIGEQILPSLYNCSVSQLEIDNGKTYTNDSIFELGYHYYQDAAELYLIVPSNFIKYHGLSSHYTMQEDTVIIAAVMNIMLLINKLESFLNIQLYPIRSALYTLITSYLGKDVLYCERIFDAIEENLYEILPNERGFELMISGVLDILHSFDYYAQSR